VHELKNRLLDKLTEQAAHMGAINWSDQTAKMHDLPGLVINGPAQRVRMGQELRGVTEEAPAEPAPLPEKKGHPEHRTVVENGRPKVVPAWSPYGHVNPSLTDINASAMKDAAARREDAITVTSKRLVEALAEEDNTQGAFERARGERTIVQKHFVDKATGTSVVKDQAIDGLRTPQNSTEARQRQSENLAKFRAENAERFK
jgi:hypothetical protein